MTAEPTWSALPVRPNQPPSAAERAAKIARQAAWAVERGAVFDALELGADAAGNSSVRARRRLASGDAIITIPRSLMLTDADLDATVTGDPNRFGGTEGSARDTMSVWLALEVEHADSPWHPFLDALPVQFPDMPKFRGGDDLVPLAGTSARLCAAATHYELVDTYNHLVEPVRERVSLAAYAWGRAIVSSRGFNAPNTVEPRLAFIPIVDLMDHAWDETAWEFDIARQVYIAHAMRDFDAGEPVHFTYGPYGNVHFLDAYGFALADNPYDETIIDIDGELFMVTAQETDARWNEVDERLDNAGIVAAARRALERLDEGDAIAVSAPATISADWRATCAVVRSGERRTLETIIANVSDRQRG
jgi:hypothetical protein